jgi:hypothetical protein
MEPLFDQIPVTENALEFFNVHKVDAPRYILLSPVQA